MKFSPLVEWIDGKGAQAWDVHFEALRRQAAGEDVIVLTVGDPDFDAPRPIVEAAIDELRRGTNHYTEFAGIPALRQAIARYQSGLLGREVAPEEVTVLPGAQNALFSAALCLFSRGDEVIVPEPAYTTYEAVVRATGASLVWVPMRARRRFHIDPRDLEAAVSPRTRALFVNFPHNPTGALLSEEEAEGIADLCRRHDLWLLSDEVYGTVVFEGRHVSPCALPGMAERSVLINSLSKSHAMTGWRLGWTIASGEITRHIGNLAQCMLYGNPSFTQAAVARWLEHDLPELGEMRAGYRRRRDLMHRRLAAVPGLEALKPESGMFMMVDIRGTGLDAEAFSRRLLDEAGVSVMAGDAFGPSAAGHLRLSLAVDEARIAQACDRIAGFVERLTPAMAGARP